VNTKYISINIEPKGSRPPARIITSGSKYHCFSGIGLGIGFTEQLISGHLSVIKGNNKKLSI
jgi:hypothetical protein